MALAVRIRRRVDQRERRLQDDAVSALDVLRDASGSVLQR